MKGLQQVLKNKYATFIKQPFETMRVIQQTKD
jgi:hypothetical protein